MHPWSLTPFIGDKNVRLYAVKEKLQMVAKQELLVTCGGVYIRLAGGNIEIHAPGKISYKGSKHDLAGPSSTNVELPIFTNSTLNWHDEQLQFVNEAGSPLKKAKYILHLENGNTVEGTTDQHGKTQRVLTSKPVAITKAELTSEKINHCCSAKETKTPQAVVVTLEGVKTNPDNLSESVQKVIAKGSYRKLTAGEISLAKAIFKDAIKYDEVKIYKDSYFWFDLQTKHTAVTPNGNLYFNPEDFKEDFSTEDKWLVHWFLHEMTHVWQYQLGYGVKWHGFWLQTFQGRKAYAYRLNNGDKFSNFNMEQQADIIGDYYAKKFLNDGKSISLSTPPFELPQYDEVLSDFFKDPKDEKNLPN